MHLRTRVAIGFSVFVLSLSNLQHLHGQAIASSVSTVLRASLQTMLGSKSVQDVSLTGTAENFAGSDDETGSFTFRATSTGYTRVDLGLPSGVRSESRQPGNNAPFGSWIMGNGVLHAAAQHNLMSGYYWAFPALIVNDMLTNPSALVSFVGIEGTLAHFSVYEQQPTASTAYNGVLQSLTKYDLWLDSSTLLPAKLAFNIHPDSTEGLDIPVQVQFSNYETISGTVTPTTVQKSVNNTLVLDAQIQSVSINTGLTADTFSLQ